MAEGRTGTPRKVPTGHRSDRFTDRFADRLDRALGRYPPRNYRLEDYKRWFPETGRAFLKHVNRMQPAPHARESTGHTIVVVGPWVSTPVPWYAVMLAMGLVRRGREVTIVWDDAAFPERHVDQQNAVIGEVLSHVGQSIPVRRLSEEAPAAADPADAAVVESLTGQNVTWRLRGGPVTLRDQKVIAKIRSVLALTLPKVRSVLDHSGADSVVVPGGVYGTSGLFFHEATLQGRRVATFDTDRRVAQICVSGVAAQNGDIPRAFAEVWAEGPETRRRAAEIARREFEDRVANRDAYGFQKLPSAALGSQGECILIPLNVEWDTAALGRHLHFAHTTEWVVSTVQTILDADAGPVVVRQHPSERRRLQASRLDIEGALREYFGGDTRCRFVGADAPVSTYDLLKASRLVLPYVSTISMEAAGMGKPVLVSGESYFAGLGFVWAASSHEEYSALLQRGLRGELGTLPEQVERAWVCYYLAAVQNRIATDFTPHPDDFWTWCRREPDSLLAERDVADILEALDRDVPVSVLRHRRTMAGAAEGP